MGRDEGSHWNLLNGKIMFSYINTFLFSHISNFRYGCNEENFEKAYPEHKKGISSLHAAIQKQQQAEGLCHRQRRKIVLSN